MSSPKRESVSVLEECIDLQKRKSQDYQNPNSNIVQAMHYRRGVSTIHDMISQKLLRAQSLLEPIENGQLGEPNFESLEDTYKDLINYASFAVSYIRGKMEGQNPHRDMLNRPLHEGHGQIEDTSGGSACGIVSDIRAAIEEAQEVEADGFITTHGLPTEEKIKSTYFTEVKPRGRVRVPDGEVNCTDPVQSTYVTRIKPKKTPILKHARDIGDRMDDTFDELAKKHSER